jgi:hypothetical protein
MKEISYAIDPLLKPPESNRYELSLLVLYGFYYRGGRSLRREDEKQDRKDGYRCGKRLARYVTSGRVVDAAGRHLEVSPRNIGRQLPNIPAFKTASQGRDGLWSEGAGTLAESDYSLKLDGSSLYLFISS